MTDEILELTPETIHVPGAGTITFGTPAADAITEVAARVEPVQPPLFEPPPFNFEGAYLELESLSVETDRLGRIHDDDARAAKESKKAWEASSLRRDQVALRLRERRLAKAVDPAEPVTEDVAPAPEPIPAAEDAHVAASETISDVAPGDTYQPCRECGAVLVSVPTGSGAELVLFDPGMKVGSGCPGKVATDVGHHYAKPGKKTRKRRPTADVEAEQAEAGA